MKSRYNLEGQLSFISGSLDGIGWATAKLLAECGSNILLNDIKNEELLNSRVDELKELYKVEAEGFIFNINDSVKLKEFYTHVFKKHKRLDVLVNNAGIMEDRFIGMINDEHIHKSFETNTYSVIKNIQYAAKLMSRNKKGSIINISSIIGLRGFQGQTVYSASKAAVIGITLSAAKELADKNIRVNAIAPGYIGTKLVEHYSEDQKGSIIENISLNKSGTAEDVANSVLFLASSMSDYITGQVIGVDGGMSI